MEHFEVEIPNGWELIEKCQNADFNSARKILLSGKYRKYSEAVKTENGRCFFCRCISDSFSAGFII